MTTGIMTIEDLLKVTNASIVEYGLDKIYELVSRDLANYNGQVSEMMTELCKTTTKQGEVFNLASDSEFTQTDEFGIPVAQKSSGSFEVAYPLNKYNYGLGWTQEYIDTKQPAELAASYTTLQAKDKKNIVRIIKKAIFNNTNYTQKDEHYNGINLTVRRFWNADSSNVPTNSAGTSFDGATHTHYKAVAASGSPTNAEIDALVSNITEHDLTENVGIYINASNVATLEGITSTKFKKLRSDLMVYNASDVTRDALAITDISNYQVGIWDGLYPVFVKPWVPANYITALALGAEKPLAFRESTYSNLQGLRLDALVSVMPLVAQNAVRYAGVGVSNRSAGAVLYTGNTSWANPTIA